MSKLEVLPYGQASRSVHVVRLTLPEALVVAMAIGLTVYLNLRGTPFHLAALAAASVVMLFVGIMAIPHGIMNSASKLHDVRSAMAAIRTADRP